MKSKIMKMIRSKRTSKSSMPNDEMRNPTHDDVFARISTSLALEDLAGTEISIT